MIMPLHASNCLKRRHEEGRWPRRLVVTLHTMLTTTQPRSPDHSRPGPLLSKSYSSSCPFPIPNALPDSKSAPRPSSGVAMSGLGPGVPGGPTAGIYGDDTPGQVGLGGAGGCQVSVPAGSACVLPTGANLELFSGERLFDAVGRGAAAVAQTLPPGARCGTSPVKGNGADAGAAASGHAPGKGGGTRQGGNGNGGGTDVCGGAKEGEAGVAAGAGATGAPSLVERVVRAAESLAAAAAGKSPPGHMITQVRRRVGCLRGPGVVGGRVLFCVGPCA